MFVTKITLNKRSLASLAHTADLVMTHLTGIVCLDFAFADLFVTFSLLCCKQFQTFLQATESTLRASSACKEDRVLKTLTIWSKMLTSSRKKNFNEVAQADWQWGLNYYCEQLEIRCLENCQNQSGVSKVKEKLNTSLNTYETPSVTFTELLVTL